MTKKCGSSDFECMIGLQPQGNGSVWDCIAKETGKICKFNLSSEEEQEHQKYINCSIGAGGKYRELLRQIENVIDRDPFTELYFCLETVPEKLNELIDNNQLNDKCEKIIF